MDKNNRILLHAFVPVVALSVGNSHNVR